LAVKERKIAKAAAPTVLPEGWRVVRFDEMAQLVNERVENPSEAGVERYVGLEHLDPESLKIRRWGSPDDVEAQKLRFQPGDIIFGKRRAYQRKLGVADFEGICSAHAMVLRAREEIVVKEFLPFFMQSDTFFERALSISVGSLSPTINWKTLANQQFSIPPKSEQRRIAEILGAVDELSEQLIIVSDDVKKMINAFWHEEFSKGKWQTSFLGNIADISNGSTPSRKVERYWLNGNIAWLPTGKVHDRIVRKADECVTADALKECSIRLYPVGSVLIAMIGEGKTRGSVAYLDIEACINQNFACAVPKKGVNGLFLFYYLDNCYEQLRNFSHGSSQGALNCRILREFPVQVPQESEQQRIVEVFQSLDAARERAEGHAATTFNLKKQLLSGMLNLKRQDVIMVS
jgi:type I restriction enzyme S subunit